MNSNKNIKPNLHEILLISLYFNMCALQKVGSSLIYDAKQQLNVNILNIE